MPVSVFVKQVVFSFNGPHKQLEISFTSSKVGSRFNKELKWKNNRQQRKNVREEFNTNSNFLISLHHSFVFDWLCFLHFSLAKANPSWVKTCNFTLQKSLHDQKCSSHIFYGPTSITAEQSGIDTDNLTIRAQGWLVQLLNENMAEPL